MNDSPAIRHKKLVHMVLNRRYRKQFQNIFRHGFTYDDLVQEGLYAILNAERGYDPSQGSESTFYANAVDNWLGYRVFRCNLGLQKRKLNGASISLDDNVRTKFNRDDDDGLLLVNTLRSKDEIDEDAVMDRLMLEKALEHLRAHSWRQCAAVRMRFFDDYDNYQIAAALDCSIQWASLLVTNGLKFLRGIYKAQGGTAS